MNVYRLIKRIPSYGKFAIAALLLTLFYFYVYHDTRDSEEWMFVRGSSANGVIVSHLPQYAQTENFAKTVAGETYSQKVKTGGPENSFVNNSNVSGALLRIIVLTNKRGKSLRRCLTSLNDAHYDGKSVEVEIHIDRRKDGKVHKETFTAALNFTFKHGRVRTIVKKKHAGVLGQWLDSWQTPADNTCEIAVFVEDDITLSPYFARYLRAVHEKYDGYPSINGYSLQAESIRHAVGASSELLRGPEGETVFLYPVLGSWGFSPHTGHWRDFIRWYRESSRTGFLPSVPGLLPTQWYSYQHFLGKAESMWTMWHIHHAYEKKLYTLYTNFPDRKGLAFNWKEPGENYVGEDNTNLRTDLLMSWDTKQLNLPDTLRVVDPKGEVTKRVMTSNGMLCVEQIMGRSYLNMFGC